MCGYVVWYRCPPFPHRTIPSEFTYALPDFGATEASLAVSPMWCAGAAVASLIDLLSVVPRLAVCRSDNPLRAVVLYTLLFLLQPLPRNRDVLAVYIHHHVIHDTYTYREKFSHLAEGVVALYRRLTY
jgi:hypothetical protein